MVTYWLSCLPITHDYEEAFTMTDLLSDLVLNYTMISSLPNQEGIGSTLANIYGEAFDDKYFFLDEDDIKLTGMQPSSRQLMPSGKLWTQLVPCLRTSKQRAPAFSKTIRDRT